MANIAINGVATRVQYTATNGQTVFSYTFPIKAAADLKVYSRASAATPDDVADLLILTTDYTVTGANTASGGTVVLVVGATVNDVVTIVGDKTIDRTAIYNQSVTLKKADLNNDFNDNVMYDKQIETIQEQLTPKYARSALIAPAVRQGNLVLPILNEGKTWVGRGNSGDSPDDVVAKDAFPEELLLVDFAIGTASALLPNAQVLGSLGSGFLANVDSGATGTLISRSFSGTASQIDLTNGTGGGNVVVSITDNPTLPGTESFQMPSGTTAQRPVAPTAGDARFNTQNSQWEGWNGVAWVNYLIPSTGANVALDNLLGVAINADLILGVDIGGDLGSQAIRWENLYAVTASTGDSPADEFKIRGYDVDGAAYVNFFTVTANNTPTAVLHGDVTGTTQAANNNSTKLATTAYADAAALGGGVVQYANLGSEILPTAYNAQIGMTDTFGSGEVTSDGVTITLTYEKDGGGDIVAYFDGGPVTIDCTPPITIALTAGTDTVPVKNYIYILKSAPTVLTKSTVSFPLGVEFVPIGEFVCQSAATVQTFGTLSTLLSSDDLWKDTTQNGITHHLATWIRAQPATWEQGIALTPTLTALGPDTLTLALSTGVVLQLQEHTFPAMNTAGGGTTNLNTFFVVNDNAAAYTQGTNLFNFKSTSAGVAATNNNRISWVVWATMSELDEDCKMFVNLPRGFYSTNADAISDALQHTNYTIPRLFQGTGFLIAKLTYQYQSGGGGSLTLVEQVDLRGTFPSTTAGGTASAGATVHLDNLLDTAINVSLVSDTDVTDDLGTQAIRWRNIYASSLQTGNTAADVLNIGAWDVDGAAISNFITLTAGNTPTCALASGVTAVTQSASDNSTKIATTAYVDTAALSGGNYVLLATVTASASATLNFTTNIDATYRGYLFRFEEIVAATDAVVLYMRVSTDGGGTYKSGASDYDWMTDAYTTAGSISAAAAFIAVSYDYVNYRIGNDAGNSVNGWLEMYNPTTTALWTTTSSLVSYLKDDTQMCTLRGAGGYMSTTAVDAVRFLLSSGNITSGKIYMYGIVT